MSKIFISYRRKESLAIAGRIYERLEAHFGAGSVFMDIDSIPPGTDFRAVLSTGVATAAVVLAVIGELWIDARDLHGRRRLDDPADFVRIELEAAFKCGIPIVPLLTGDAAMPHQNDLPESLRLLPFLNALLVDPGRDFNVHMDRLIGHLEEQAALSPAGGEPRRGGGAGYTAVELARFDAIKGSKDPQDFRDFLSRFPKGHMADLVQKRLRTLEEAHWVGVKESTAPRQLDEFLRLFPDGTHAEEARSRLSVLRPEHQRWESIKESLDPDDFSNFLKEFPSGAYAATARQRNIDLQGGLIRIFTEDSEVLCAALSPDGRIALSGGSKLRLWDTSSGQPVRELAGHAERGEGLGIHSVAFSPDGQHVLSQARGGSLGLWEVSTGRLLRSLGVYSAAFSPDGRYILAGRGLWETATGELIREFGAGEGYSQGFSPDGRFVLWSAGHVGRSELTLWEVPTGRLIRSLAELSNQPQFVFFSPDGRHILVRVHTRGWSLLETATGRLVREFDTGFGDYRSALSPDGRLLLTLSSGTLGLWDVFTGQLIHRIQENHRSCCFSPNGRFILSGAGSQLELWAVATGRRVHTFVGHSGTVHSVVFSLDGQFALSGSRDHTLRLWHVAAFYPEETESQPPLWPETAPAPPLTDPPPQPHSWWRRTFG